MARLLVAVILCGTLLVVALLPASSRAEPTRAEYVAQADSICRSQLIAFWQDTPKLRAALKKLGHRIIFFAPDAQQKADSPPNRKLFKRVGRFYRLAANFIDTLTGSLWQLAVPSADAATISKWLASRRVLAHHDRLLGKAYPHRKLRRIYQLLLALTKSPFPPRALDSFGFRYCYGRHASPF
jgi:hypothetical protein